VSKFLHNRIINVKKYNFYQINSLNNQDVKNGKIIAILKNIPLTKGQEE